MNEATPQVQTFRGKWILDGCSTLAECAAQLRSVADDFERLDKEGYRLNDPVADDYGEMVPPASLREV